jgi:plastocyanin
MAKLAINLLSLLIAVAGCDNASPAPAPAPAAVNADNGLGTVRGKATLTGFTPPPPAAAAKTVQCGSHQVPLVDETVALNSDGTLRNVIIYLKNAPPSAGSGVPAPALLDQVNCVFKPHVLTVLAGQAVRFKSSDPTLHNVHTLCEHNPAMNIGMSKDQTREARFDSAEIFRVKCDVHPWMSAWIGVFSHPHYSMTADGGKFEIANIPAGQQTLVAWHERFGELEQTVTITRDKTSDISFDFKPPRKE